MSSNAGYGDDVPADPKLNGPTQLQGGLRAKTSPLQGAPREETSRRTGYQAVPRPSADESCQSRRSSLDGAACDKDEQPPRLDAPDKCDPSFTDATAWNHRHPRRNDSRSPQAVRAWAPEIAWCLFATAILVFLGVLLGQYDDQQLPNWPLGLTLNTVAALLATICRSAMVIPIAEGISQLKWNWFVAGQRPIRDLYLFDQASRGPWGSLLLITKARGRQGCSLPWVRHTCANHRVRFFTLSTLAAIVLVTSLASSFLTQSAISYSTRLVARNDSRVIARAARSFPEGMSDASILNGETYSSICGSPAHIANGSV